MFTKRSITFSTMPPSANSMRTSFVRNGKVCSAKSKQYAAWQANAAKEVMAQKGAGQVSEPYSLDIALKRNWKSKRPQDVDNRIKPISDALVIGGLLADDYLCERVTAYWSDHIPEGAVIATVEVL